MISRPNFIELCRQVTQIDEQAFQELWQQLGLSIDREQGYATIDDHCRRTSQLSFLKLLAEGHAYATEAPTLWDVDFQTAVAQAEVEDRPLTGHSTISALASKAAVRSSSQQLVQLLSACVASIAHPEVNVTSRSSVNVLSHHFSMPQCRSLPTSAQASKRHQHPHGVHLRRCHRRGVVATVDLPLRQVVGKDGRLIPVQFGSPGWESLIRCGQRVLRGAARETRPASEEGHH